MKNILVPVDFSDCAPKVIKTAVSIATKFSGHLILLHVAPPEPEFIGYDPGPQSVRDSVARELAGEHANLQKFEQDIKSPGLKTTALVIQGYPVDKILEEAKKVHADLIVMGSHGHGALRNLLVGSVAEGVLRKAACPVLIVPSKSC